MLANIHDMYFFPEGPSKSADELAELMAWLEDTNPLSNESLSRVCIQMADFDKALKIVQVGP